MYIKTHEIGKTMDVELGEHNYFSIELTNDLPNADYQYLMTGKFVTVSIYLNSDEQGAIYSDFVKNGYVKLDGDIHLISEKGIMHIAPNTKKLLFSWHIHTEKDLLEIEFVMKPEVTIQGTFVAKTILHGYLIV